MREYLKYANKILPFLKFIQLKLFNRSSLIDKIRWHNLYFRWYSLPGIFSIINNWWT